MSVFCCCSRHVSFVCCSDGWLVACYEKRKTYDIVNDLYFTVTFLLTAVFNMCVVSYDRLTAIALPMEKRITMRSAKMTMFLTWMVGLTISTPFAIYRNYKVSLESFWSDFRQIVYTNTYGIV